MTQTSKDGKRVFYQDKKRTCIYVELPSWMAKKDKKGKVKGLKPSLRFVIGDSQ